MRQEYRLVMSNKQREVSWSYGQLKNRLTLDEAIRHIKKESNFLVGAPDVMLAMHDATTNPEFAIELDIRDENDGWVLCEVLRPAVNPDRDKKSQELWDRVVGPNVVIPEVPSVNEEFWLGTKIEQADEPIIASGGPSPFNRPPLSPETAAEIRDSLDKMKREADESFVVGVDPAQEGAVRWLTVYLRERLAAAGGCYLKHHVVGVDPAEEGADWTAVYKPGLSELANRYLKAQITELEKEMTNPDAGRSFAPATEQEKAIFAKSIADGATTGILTDQPKTIDATKRILVFYYPEGNKAAMERAEKNAARVVNAETLVIPRYPAYTGPVIEVIDPL